MWPELERLSVNTRRNQEKHGISLVAKRDCLASKVWGKKILLSFFFSDAL